MKKALAIGLVAFALAAAAIRADPVTPANVIITNFTGVTSVEFASDATFYQGDTLSLSNSVMYSGAGTNSAVQNLDGCGITARAGSGTDTGLVTTVTGYAVSTNAGTYGAEFTVPATDPCYIEVTVSNGFSRTYERWKVRTRAHLGE